MWALSEAYVLLGLRSYSEWFGKLSSDDQHTHLGAHHPPSGVTFLTHHHKFSHSISPFQFMCLSLSLSSLLLLGFTNNHEYGALFGRPWPPLIFTLCPFQFCNCISFSPYLDFHFCLCEVNLHTYLTTWLSSCLVGIFLRFSPLIAQISILSKSVTINENI